MRHNLLLSLLLGLSILALPVRGLCSADAGTESALYLASGARSAAMGSAGLVNVNSADAMIWNPANLVYMPSITVTLQHAALLGDTSHDILAANYPTLDWGGVGLSLLRMETGDIDRRDMYNLSTGSFGYMEQEALIGYAYPVLPYFSAGLNFKVHHLRLEGLESIAPGVDIGFLLNLPGHLPKFIEESVLKEVQLGFCYRNFVTPVMELLQYEDQLFSNWRLGAGAVFSFFPKLGDRLQVNVDMEKPERANFRWHAGFDYQVYEMFSLRAGWDHEYLSAGLGATYHGYTIDYAISFPEIGARHMITLSAALGRNMNDLRERRHEEEERKRQAIIDNLKHKMIEGYRKQAMDLTEKGDYAAAVPLWEKVLDWEPENKDVQERLTLAQAAVTRKLNSESLKLANQYYQDERYIDAMVECRSVLERDPENIHANQLYTRSEKQAQSLGQNALVTNVKMVRTIREAYQKGLEAYTERDWARAIKYWETVIENTPLQKQVYRYLRYARTRLATATENQETKSKIDKKETTQRKLYKEAVDKAKSGQLKDAMKTWEKLVKENPEDKDAKKNLEETKKNLIDSQKKGIRW